MKDRQPPPHSPSPIFHGKLTTNYIPVSGANYKAPLDSAVVNENGAYDFTNQRLNIYRAGILQVVVTYYCVAPPNSTHVATVTQYPAVGGYKDYKKLIQFNDIQASVIGASGASTFFVDVGDYIQYELLQIFSPAGSATLVGSAADGLTTLFASYIA